MNTKLHEILNAVHMHGSSLDADIPTRGLGTKEAEEKINKIILEARLDEAEKMWEKFGGWYADASDLCEYAPDRIKDIKAKLGFKKI